MKSSDKCVILLILLLGLIGLTVLILVLNSKKSPKGDSMKITKGDSKKSSKRGSTDTRTSKVSKRTVSFATSHEGLHPNAARVPFPETIELDLENPPQVLHAVSNEPFLIANVDDIQDRTYGLSPGSGLVLDRNLTVGSGDYPLEVKFVKDPQDHFTMMTPEGNYLQIHGNTVQLGAKPSTFGVYRSGLIQEAGSGKYLRVDQGQLTASSAFGTPIRLVTV